LTCKCGVPYAFSFDHNYFCINEKCPVISPSFPVWDFFLKSLNITDNRTKFEFMKVISLFKNLWRMSLSLKQQLDLEAEMRIWERSRDPEDKRFNDLQDQINALLIKVDQLSSSKPQQVDKNSKSRQRLEILKQFRDDKNDTNQTV
jgi:hypothetical protein